MKNKKGWIKIIEAFFSIVLIMGILLIVINRDSSTNEDAIKIYQEGNSLLQGIELNNSLRQEILSSTPPIEWTSFISEDLTGVRNYILNQTPNYLNCSAKICFIEEDCISNQNINSNVYTNSISIYANKNTYSPRQLKLFCWEKGGIISSSSSGGGESCTPDCSGVLDANTKLLIHSDTTDGSITFTDSSDSEHIITRTGEVHHEVDQQKFGATSMYFDGTGDYLSIPDSEDWYFGTGDFTIDGWIRVASVAVDQNNLVAQWNNENSGKAWIFRWVDGSGLEFVYSTDGTANTFVSKSWTPTINTWYHVAVVRESADLKLYVDGTQIGTTHNIASDSIYNSAWNLAIGALYGSGSAYGWSNEYIDELRISKGKALWTSDFSGDLPSGPAPAGKECGDDGCGGSCGSCGGGETCESGICLPPCTDTCSSLGYECGIQTICGASVNCSEIVGCSVGETCESGICVSSLFGDGSDGILSLSGVFNINDQTSGGRSYADGIAYKVSSNPITTSIDVGRTPNGFATGDKAIIINMQGTSADYSDVGNYEILNVVGTSGNYINVLAAPLISLDGTTWSNQKVIIQRIPQYSSVVLDSSDKLTTSGWDGLTRTPSGAYGYKTGIIAFFVDGSLSISSGAMINTSGLGYRGGPPVHDSQCYQGESYGGLGILSSTNNLGGGGGGYGGSQGSPAGGGGYGTAGETTAAIGGAVYGNSPLSKIYLGSGGGGIGAYIKTGGYGGGIIYISSDQVVVGGTIVSNGTGNMSTTNAGTGGGSGGTIFIQSNDITITPGLINAKGFTVPPVTYTRSGSGGDGRIRIDSPIISGTTSPSYYS